MTNLIGKKVSEENETARAIFVGQDSVLNGRFLKPDEFAEYLGIRCGGSTGISRTSRTTASGNICASISNRPPCVIGSKAWNAGLNNDASKQARGMIAGMLETRGLAHHERSLFMGQSFQKGNILER